jgi:hypothetical protein
MWTTARLGASRIKAIEVFRQREGIAGGVGIATGSIALRTFGKVDAHKDTP